MTTPVPAAQRLDTRTLGWIEAALFAFLIAILSTAYTMAAARGVHTVVFILYSLLISATSLLASPFFPDTGT